MIDDYPEDLNLYKIPEDIQHAYKQFTSKSTTLFNRQDPRWIIIIHPAAQYPNQDEKNFISNLAKKWEKIDRYTYISPSSWNEQCHETHFVKLLLVKYTRVKTVLYLVSGCLDSSEMKQSPANLKHGELNLDKYKYPYKGKEIPETTAHAFERYYGPHWVVYFEGGIQEEKEFAKVLEENEYKWLESRTWASHPLAVQTKLKKLIPHLRQHAVHVKVYQAMGFMSGGNDMRRSCEEFRNHLFLQISGKIPFNAA